MSVQGEGVVNSFGPVSYRALRAEELSAAGVLLTETNYGQAPASLIADLAPSQARWPSLQVGAFDAGGRLVGLVSGRLDKGDAQLGWSDDIVLLDAYRGSGLGGTLLERQLEAFRVLGCTRVRGLSPAPLFSAIAFFERHGFRVVERTVASGLWGIEDGVELWVTERVL